MVTVQSKMLSLGVFLLEILWLLVAQTLGNTVLLWPCLACFLVLAVWSAIRGMALPFLMLFLPFAPLIKLRPGTISFYTIALLLVLVVYIVKGSKNISVTHFIPGLTLIALTLVVKTLYGYPIENSYILFSASLLLVPFLKRELAEKYDFYWLTMFFSFGVVVAALSARILVIFPTITRYYIHTHELLGILRFSGFYGDPNFYSAHITAALSGIFILLLNRTTRARFWMLMLSVVALLFCGFMSVSKSFLVILVALVLVWLLALMFERGRITAKLTIVFTLLIGVAFLLASTAFTDMVDMMIERVTSGQNISDFTTGRVEIWKNYFNLFSDNSQLLLFGQGLTKVYLINDASHNTIIQAIYQFGLVGVVVLAVWWMSYVRILLTSAKIKWRHWVQIAILLIGAIGPWMGLDFLLFDEFFLLPMYVCVGIMFLTNTEQAETL
jgi:hypothetical protein